MKNPAKNLLRPIAAYAAVAWGHIKRLEESDFVGEKPKDALSKNQ